MRCPFCGARAYVGLVEVRCSNPDCRSFSASECRRWLLECFDYTAEQADAWIAKYREAS